MNTTPILPSVKRESDQERILQVILVLATFVYPGIVSLAIASFIARWLHRRRRTREYAWFGVALVLSAGALLVSVPGVVGLARELPSLLVSGDASTFLVHMALIWFAGIAAAPLGGVIMSLWRELMRELFGGFDRLGDYMGRALQQQDAEVAYELRQTRQEAQEKPPAPVDDQLLLGVKVGQWDAWHNTADYVGFVARDNWLAIHDGVLNTHAIVVGKPGSGKTEFLKRLIVETIRNTNRRVVFIDGKGEEELATTFRNLVWTYTKDKPFGRYIAPIVRIGYDNPGDKYNGFLGSSLAIKTRTGAMVGIDADFVNNASADGAYYKRIQDALLGNICYPPGTEGPPRSFAEVQHRLASDWLEIAYANNAAKLKDIKDMSKHRFDLARAFEGFVQEFSGIISQDGYSFDNSQYILFSIKSGSAGHVGNAIVKFIIEDLKNYMENRLKEPTLFIIDEFGSFGSKNISDILTRGRSAQLGVVLATQSKAGFGDEETYALVTETVGTQVLFAVNDPEPFAMRAGTIKAAEIGMQVSEGQGTGVGTVRMQDQFSINMNEARKLPPGQAYLIRSGYKQKIQVVRVKSDEIEAAPAERRAELLPTEEPAITPIADDGDVDLTKPIA